MRQQYHRFRESYPLGLDAAAADIELLSAVRIVCNLRGVSGTVKGGRPRRVYTALLWMHMHASHPATLVLTSRRVGDISSMTSVTLEYTHMSMGCASMSPLVNDVQMDLDGIDREDDNFDHDAEDVDTDTIQSDVVDEPNDDEKLDSRFVDEACCSNVRR
ncbi:hypothetical protein ACQ4PT_023022 [Festuca glaucescens]